MRACADPGVQRRDLGLRGDGLAGEQRVLGRDHADHLGGIDLVGVVDRDDEVAFVRQALQRVHPVVRRGRQRASLGPGAVVPGGPRLRLTRHGPHVGVHVPPFP